MYVSVENKDYGVWRYWLNANESSTFKLQTPWYCLLFTSDNTVENRFGEPNDAKFLKICDTWLIW